MPRLRPLPRYDLSDLKAPAAQSPLQRLLGEARVDHNAAALAGDLRSAAAERLVSYDRFGPGWLDDLDRAIGDAEQGARWDPA